MLRSAVWHPWCLVGRVYSQWLHEPSAHNMESTLDSSCFVATRSPDLPTAARTLRTRREVYREPYKRHFWPPGLALRRSMPHRFGAAGGAFVSCALPIHQHQ
jgi:hypothetical protein